ncbi:MAG: hypothetical protein QNJ84_06550 [Alphaproteobacteria bacterium]|nr:hypothetical protein [Alphaproteobacteria bacterium]
MRKLLQRRGYDDWVAEVEGYGASLEIRAFATRMHDGTSLPDDRLRANAPVRLAPPKPDAAALEKDPRIRSLMAFSEAFRRKD